MDVLFSCWMPLESCLQVPNYLKQLPNAASRLKPLWSIHFNTQHYHWLASREGLLLCLSGKQQLLYSLASQETTMPCHCAQDFPPGAPADEPSGTPKRNGFILPSALLGRGYIICSSTIINKSLYTLPTEKNFISQKQLWQILLRQHSLGNTTQYPAPKPWLTHFRNDSNYQKNSIKTWGLSNPLIGLEFIY